MRRVALAGLKRILSGYSLLKKWGHWRKRSRREIRPMSLAIGDYLCNRVYGLPSSRCWWCGRNGKQTRHYLFVNCVIGSPIWGVVGAHCEWKNPRAPREALLFDGDRGTGAVLFWANRGPRPSTDGLVSVDGLAMAGHPRSPRMAWSSSLK